MEKNKDKDVFQAAKEAEARVQKLQAELQHLKQRIQLSESVQKAEEEENLKKFQDNKQRIKKLQSQVDELQIRLNRGLKGDEKLIAKAFRQHSREVGFLAKKSGREAIAILDDKVLDLIKRRNALIHKLQQKEKKLRKLEEDAKTIKRKGEDQSETETAVRIRELENEYMKVEKNLMECQVIQTKYKAIQEQLRKELAVYPKLIDDLEEEHEQQRCDVERLTASELLARDRRDRARMQLTKAESGATKARLEKERVIGEFGKALKPRQLTSESTSQRPSTELGDTEEAEEWRRLRAEQENELKNMKEAFEKIKAAIGISDISKAESRFLTQKRTVDELSDLVSRAEERRHELLEELDELRSKKESLQGAELARPQVVLEQELKTAKESQTEQSNRMSAAKVETDRIKKLTGDVKSALWHQLQLVEKYASEESTEAISPDTSLSDISSRLEAVVKNLLEKLREHDLDELKASLIEDQLLQKMDAVKLAPAPGSGRKMKQAEEEESSDDEDLEKKRNQLKKEAEIYAEMKKKQQGRGRMMML